MSSFHGIRHAPPFPRLMKDHRDPFSRPSYDPRSLPSLSLDPGVRYGYPRPNFRNDGLDLDLLPFCGGSLHDWYYVDPLRS